MATPTHCIEIEARLNNGWDEKEIRDYCTRKLHFKVDSIWYPELESLNFDGKTARASVLIQSVFYDFTKYAEEIEDWIYEWIENYITEPGIDILNIKINPLGKRLELMMDRQGYFHSRFVK